MKKLGIFLIASLLIMQGCGAKTTKRTCKITSDGINEVMTITAKGDLVTSTQSEMSVDFATLGITDEEQKTQFKEVMEAQFTDIKGVESTFEMKENQLLIVVNIDFNKVETMTLVSLGLLQDASESKVSLKLSIEGLEQSGYQCAQ